MTVEDARRDIDEVQTVGRALLNTLRLADRCEDAEFASYIRDALDEALELVHQLRAVTALIKEPDETMEGGK
jgi:hypothetical protein